MNTTKPIIDSSLNLSEMRSKWAWFMALGLVLLLLGLLAFGNLVIATTVSVLFVGVLMTLGSALSLVHAFQVKTWPSFMGWLSSGVMYGIAGAVTFSNPLLAASTLTLILAFTLITSGLVRLWFSVQMRPHAGWGWVTASGLVTLLAGIVFVMDWPINSLWLLGMMLAFDLTFQGFTIIALSLSMRSAD